MVREQELADALLVMGTDRELEGLFWETDDGLRVNEDAIWNRILPLTTDHWLDEAVFRLIHRKSESVLWKFEIFPDVLKDEAEDIA